jgi:hypothetical protein
VVVVATYTRLSLIGEGGQGAVYRARRVEDGQLVAIKYLGEDADEHEVGRFLREVRLQASLHHPNILPVLGYHLTEPPYFFVMPLAKANLYERLSELSREPDLAFSYFEQVLAAIEHAHGNGVVHRDLKPQNILILDGPEGEYPVVSDFGLGKQVERDTTPLTGSDAFVGTPGYAAPEQFGHSRDVDERCDIHSLGIILYELLGGRGVSISSSALARLPGGLGYVVEKCIQPDPNDRYASVAELRGDFAMFTTQTELLEAPEQAAKRLVEALAVKSVIDRDSLWQLHTIFCDNLEDEILLRRVFPQLPDNVLDAYVRQFPGDFAVVLRAYDEGASGGLAFEYCDVVARFYSSLYPRFRDTATRKLLLGRLLDIAVSHNRFFVMDVVTGMLARIQDPAEAAVARDVLLEHPYECRRMKDRLLSEIRLPLLRNAVQAAARREGPAH